MRITMTSPESGFQAAWTITATGVWIGVFLALGAGCALTTFILNRKLAHETHGTSRMILGMPMMLFGFLTVIFLGVASLISQYA